MSENLDDFENLFDELDFEIQDEAPVSDEEKSLLDDSKKAAKPEGEEPVKIKVPASEEDFLNSLEDKDEIEEIDQDDKKEIEEDSEEVEDDEDDDKKEKLGPEDYFKAVGKGLMGLGKFGDIPEDFEWTEESFLEKFDEIHDGITSAISYGGGKNLNCFKNVNWIERK
jgi:hypothetical protein